MYNGKLQPLIPTLMHIKRLPIHLRIGSTLFMYHCSTRAAQGIKGHHRPVIALTFLVLTTQSPSKKQRARNIFYLRLIVSQSLAR